MKNNEDLILAQRIRENQILAKQQNPGIFKVTCLKTNKVYLGEADMLVADVRAFCQELLEGIGENSELFVDFQKFGRPLKIGI